jgi:hypothetical protein
MSLRIVSIAPWILALLVIFQVPMAMAQTPSGGGRNQAQSTNQLTGTRKQLATIIFAGLAGAILGLSTLSFYGKPQEKLDNIAVGAALGIIGGAIYSTYQVATAPYEMYDVRFAPTGEDLKYAHNEPVLNFNWDF